MFDVYVIKFSGLLTEDVTVVISDVDLINDKSALKERCKKEFNLDDLPDDECVSASWYGYNSPYKLSPVIEIRQTVDKSWDWKTVVEFEDGASGAIRHHVFESGKCKKYKDATAFANVSFHNLELKFNDNGG